MPQLMLIIRRVWSGNHGGAIFTGVDSEGKTHRIIASKDTIHRVPVPGEQWSIQGQSRFHKHYGLQIEADQAIPTRPQGEMLVSFLANNRAFRGVGEIRARKLWEIFGERLYNLLDIKEKTPIAEILGSELTATLMETWGSFRAEGQVVRWLDEHGFRIGLATKVMRLWGTEAPEKIQGNPYRMLAVAPWERVDDAAMNLGFAPMAPERRIAAVEAVCYQHIAQKNTIVMEKDLLHGVSNLLHCSLAESLEALTLAQQDKAVIQAGVGRWQALGPAVMEGFIQERIRLMVIQEDTSSEHLFWSRPSDGNVNSLIAEFQMLSRVQLTDEQQLAVWLALTQRFGLILGGAGTGKTTMLKAVCHAMEQMDGIVHAIALAGRAAMRLREATGRPARTIAGFLGALQRGDLKLGGSDLIILDEASMVDLPLTYTLLRTIPKSCRMVLVGDPYQLPPIGMGIVFAAYCDDDRVPKVELTKVHRQAAETGIPSFAGKIRRGELPNMPRFTGPGMGVSFLESAPKDALGLVIEVLGSLECLTDTQILGVTKRGPTGIMAINETLHHLRSVGKPTRKGFAPNDPVIYLQNDYERMIWNGTLGAVESLESSLLKIRWDDHDQSMTMTEEDLENMGLAYAISVHKAQGSQFRRVIIPVFPSRLLDRTLIYTALTRATEQVVFLGDRSALEQAVVAPPAPHRRMHGLAAKSS